MGDRHEPGRSDRSGRPDRSEFSYWQQVPTRWMDNDVYGHVNNVTYYSYFDTVVNTHLVDAGVLDPATSDVFGVVVETGCRFYEPLSFPETVEAGLRVARLGTTSVSYEIGLFRVGRTESAAAGRFVHVYVHRTDRRPRPVPDPVRRALAELTG